MDNWIWFLVLVAIVIIVTVARKSSAVIEKVDDSKIGYRKKPLLSSSERKFLNILKDLESGVLVIPQVNLASVIQKTGDFKWQNELYRNVDFGIFDMDYNLLLLIELNDSSHQQPNRRQRDAKVRDICAKAGVKVMAFYTNKPNEKSYVLRRIKEKIIHE